jgi:ABC-2 type transport system permease protein
MTTAAPPRAQLAPAERSPVMSWLDDGWTTTRRNLQRIRHVPDVLIFATLQPIMFVLLFTFVYGGSINVPGASDASTAGYAEFFMAGIFAQTVVFGSTYSGSAMAEDLKEGIIDRFRTLPMSPSAVLIGRTNGDLVINAVSMTVMLVSGFIVGWRVRSSPLEAIAAVALLLLFSYAFSWVMAFLGMSVRTPETINNVSFLVLFPLTFISNAFVPAENLPTPLRVFAEYNPVSALVLAARTLFGNVPEGYPEPTSWTLQNPVLTIMIGIVVLLAVFVPLSIRKFSQISSR